VASTRKRERALARAKAERQVVRRAEAARRRRQWQAGTAAAISVAVLTAGAVWAAGGFDADPPVPADCAWTPRDEATNTDLRDVGTPPTRQIPKSGSKTMTITTNLGVVEAQLDLAKAPCTAASFSYLADKKFFDGSRCHRLTNSGIYVLQCGDPSATGRGGPTYQFADENLPQADPAASPSAPASADPSASTDPAASASPSAPAGPNLYSRGVLAMANSGPGTNGSQFFIVYQDGSALEPKYSVFGVVTRGLDLVDRVAQAGIVDASGQSATDGAPKSEVSIQSLTVTNRSEQ